MRRTMPALILLATLVAPAAAQTQSTAAPLSPPTITSESVLVPGTHTYADSMPYAFGGGTGSNLAAYMNCGPNHPDLWASYPAERAARLNHLYAHLNGCDCLDLKRHLHSYPSQIGCGQHACKDGCNHGACGQTTCEGTPTVASKPVVNRYKSEYAEGFSKLHGTASAAPATARIMPTLAERVRRDEPDMSSGVASTTPRIAPLRIKTGRAMLPGASKLTVTALEPGEVQDQSAPATASFSPFTSR